MVPFAAKSNTLTPDQIADYNGSLEQIRDIQLAIDYKANEAARKRLPSPSPTSPPSEPPSDHPLIP